MQCFPGGHAGEHEDGGHAAFHAGDDVRIHAVADHDGFGRVAAQQAETGAHHERIRLAAKIGLPAGGHLNRCHQCTAGRRDPIFNRSRDIGVCTDQLRAVHDEIRGLRQGIQRIGAALAHHHIVRIHVIHGDAGVIERIQKSGLADGEDRAARRLVFQKRSRRQGAGIEVLLRDIQSHPRELLVQLPRRIAAVVCKEEILLMLVLQPLDELMHARKNLISVVDHAIHIAYKSLDFVKLNA